METLKLPFDGLSQVDRLNIIFFGEMELPAAERKLRAVMAAALQEIVRRYYDTIQGIGTPFIDTADRMPLYAAAAVVLAREYRSLFERYYELYVSTAGGLDGTPYQGTSAWEREHSEDFAAWITATAIAQPGISFTAAHVISVIRTEINAICNLALLDCAFRNGKRRKIWKTFGDSKVRPTHRKADGQEVPIDEPFDVGGYKMMFPNDSSLGAPPQEIVNCRCTMITT